MAGQRTQGVQNPVWIWTADLHGGRASPGMKGGVRGKRGAGDGAFGLHSTLLMGISRD